jgi:hypothetical protein
VVNVSYNVKVPKVLTTSANPDCSQPDAQARQKQVYALAYASGYDARRFGQPGRNSFSGLILRRKLTGS